MTGTFPFSLSNKNTLDCGIHSILRRQCYRLFWKLLPYTSYKRVPPVNTTVIFGVLRMDTKERLLDVSSYAL